MYAYKVIFLVWMSAKFNLIFTAKFNIFQLNLSTESPKNFVNDVVLNKNIFVNYGIRDNRTVVNKLFLIE